VARATQEQGSKIKTLSQVVWRLKKTPRHFPGSILLQSCVDVCSCAGTRLGARTLNKDLAIVVLVVRATKHNWRLFSVPCLNKISFRHELISSHIASKPVVAPWLALV
jgi:hypothetical protein